MHARRILDDFLRDKCPAIHAKRRNCLVKVTCAARKAGLGLVKIANKLGGGTSLLNRIKCCDRLLSNPHLVHEKITVYRALTHTVLACHTRVIIAVDWSEIREDGSLHLLRAAAVLNGRAFTLYEEIHPVEKLSSSIVERDFMKVLKSILPPQCKPIIITDAGFHAIWFQMLNDLGFAWIGRIRSLHLVCKEGDTIWVGACKTLYPRARSQARDLGSYRLIRARPTACKLILFKGKSKGRHKKTKLGLICQSKHSKKNATGQRDPWLLAASPNLASLGAKEVVKIYAGRMQIEQTFRDLKNQQWGMGLRASQTKGQNRLAVLLLIGALLSYALWLIGLAARSANYTVAYGSKSKAQSTLSILSLAIHCLEASRRPRLSKNHFKRALATMTSMVRTYEI